MQYILKDSVTGKYINRNSNLTSKAKAYKFNDKNVAESYIEYFPTCSVVTLTKL
jgi:hypothetical protein